MLLFCRGDILKAAKALVEDTKQLVMGANTGQEKLAAAAQSSTKTITELANCVKMGALSLGNDETSIQLVLMGAVRDVADALKSLIESTKNASGKLNQDHAQCSMQNAARVSICMKIYLKTGTTYNSLYGLFRLY